MADRRLLHLKRLDEFLAWCQAQGHEVRPGRGDWQLAQIRLAGESAWQVIFSRARMPEHPTVPDPLVKHVRQFIDATRAPQAPHAPKPPKRVPRVFQVAGEDPPWD